MNARFDSASKALLALTITGLAMGCSAGSTDDESSTEGAVTGNSSAYTDLGPLDEHCSLVKKAPKNEGDWADYECGGMGGYTLNAGYDDGRENIVVKTPNGSEHNLEVWSQFSGFGHLGPKAEWRGPVVSPGQVNPTALIFRYYQANPETGAADRSSLLVARITPNAACIYAKVDGTQAGSNEQARVEADKASTVRCPSEASGQVTSEYTPLDSSDGLNYPECKKIDSAACSSSQNLPFCQWDCGGMGEYKAIVNEGDWTTLSVLSNSGEHHIPVGSLVGHLGPKAEWRGIKVGDGKVDPFALIFRYIQQDKLDPPKYHHSLVVVKLANSTPCVFDIVDATEHDNANVLARESAERSRSQGCPANPPQLPPISLDD